MTRPKKREGEVTKGRPTLYKTEYDQMLINHMSQGLSFESFAGLVDVDRDTIYNWVQIHPSFSDAKKRAQEKCRIFWEKLGVGLAFGKVKDGNSTAWIYNMKCRFREHWGDTTRIEQSGEIKITSNVPLNFES